jgi:hypothetical protein
LVALSAVEVAEEPGSRPVVPGAIGDNVAHNISVGTATITEAPWPGRW